MAEVTGRITADEAARLREILGIKMEEIALEQERTPAIEQENDLLIQQQNIMVNIGSSSSRVPGQHGRMDRSLGRGAFHLQPSSDPAGWAEQEAEAEEYSES